MLVSILIPAYNAERWVSAAIASAMDQTWPRKEIIVVDDGSTDHTLSVARRYEAPSVKVVSQGNRGAAAARNRAFSLAQGEYIQWLDADDLLAPGKITAQMEVARAVADERTLFSSSFGRFHSDLNRARFLPGPLWQDLPPVDWIVTKFGNHWMNPAVWLVSRRLAELAGPWNEDLSLDDDGEYFSRLVAKSNFVRFVPAARSYYRKWSPGTLSRASSDEACRSLYLSISSQIDYLLFLEDSTRTRQAAVSYLQTWMLYFYPEKTALLGKLNQLACDLDGRLTPPQLPWKYRMIKNTLGWAAAKRLKEIVSNGGLLFRFNLELLSKRLLPR